MENKKTIIITVVGVLAAVLMTVGSTYAYLKWTTNSAQNTIVNFIVNPDFSCSADGGGNITDADVQLMPAACTNTTDNGTHVIKRTVVVSRVISQSGLTIYLDMWLKVNSIGSGLAASNNFKYALTTNSNSCTSGTVVAQGNFNGAQAGDEILLINSKSYSATGDEQYYLWIWLDAAETSSATQNQTFNLELGGSCTDQPITP